MRQGVVEPFPWWANYITVSILVLVPTILVFISILNTGPYYLQESRAQLSIRIHVAPDLWFLTRLLYCLYMGKWTVMQDPWWCMHENNTMRKSRKGYMHWGICNDNRRWEKLCNTHVTLLYRGMIWNSRELWSLCSFVNHNDSFMNNYWIIIVQIKVWIK